MAFGFGRFHHYALREFFPVLKRGRVFMLSSRSSDMVNMEVSGRLSRSNPLGVARFQLGACTMAMILDFKPRKAGSRHYEEPAAIIDFRTVRDMKSASANGDAAVRADAADASLPGKEG